MGMASSELSDAVAELLDEGHVTGDLLNALAQVTNLGVSQQWSGEPP